MKRTSRYRPRPLLAALSLLAITTTASAFHGTAVTIRPDNDTEIVIAFDLGEQPDPSGYAGSPYGFVRDVLEVAASNEQAFRSVENTITIFLDIEPDGGLTYSASREVDGSIEAIEQRRYGRPLGTRFVEEVICAELLRIDCSARAEDSAEPVIAFDQARLVDNGQLPFASVSPFPPSPASDLNVYTDTADVAAAADATSDAAIGDALGGRLGDDVRLSGSIGDAVDYLAGRARTEGAASQDVPDEDQPQQDAEVPFERRSDAANVGIAQATTLGYATSPCTALPACCRNRRLTGTRRPAAAAKGRATSC